MTIETRNGEVLFRIDPRKGKDAARISELVCTWAAVAEKYRAGEISRDEYDQWRYYYPQYDDTQITTKSPSLHTHSERLLNMDRSSRKPSIKIFVVTVLSQDSIIITDMPLGIKMCRVFRISLLQWFYLPAVSRCHHNQAKRTPQEPLRCTTFLSYQT